MYWLLAAVLAVVFSPVLVVIAPLAVVCLPVLCAFNILRATKGSPRRSMRLAKETVRTIYKQLFVYIPAIIPVGWFYVTKSTGTAHQGIRCHVPYEAYFVAWRRRRHRPGNSQVGETSSSAPATPAKLAATTSPSGTPSRHHPALAPTVPESPFVHDTPRGQAAGNNSALQQATGVLFGFPPQTPLPYHPAGNRSFSSPLGGTSSSFGGASSTSFSSAVFHATQEDLTTAIMAPSFPARGRLSLCTLDVYSAASAASRNGSFSSSSSTGVEGNNTLNSKSANGSSSASRSHLAPVVVFLHGGSWSWGEKWHYATIAHQLRSSAGCCVVVPDYPTFPRGTILDMLESVHAVLQWVKDHAALYGGDANDIHLVGHSAGAHLAALWAVRHAMALIGVSCAALFQQKDHEALSVTTRKASSSTPALPISLFGLPRSRHATSSRLPNSAGRCADTLSVDFATGPHITSLMLFAGVFDLPAHQLWQESRCVDATSALASAVDGLWRESSPTLLLNELASAAAKHNAQRSNSPEGTRVLLDVVPSKVTFFHDPKDEVVSFSQSEACHQAWSRCLSAFSNGETTPGKCPPVVVFPHGHDTIALTSMRQRARQPSQKGEHVHQPLIDEITRAVNL